MLSKDAALKSLSVYVNRRPTFEIKGRADLWLTHELAKLMSRSEITLKMYNNKQAK